MISHEAENMNADLVVLASQSRGGWEELLAGSVARCLVQCCLQPIAVLHLRHSFQSSRALAAALAASPAASGKKTGNTSMATAGVIAQNFTTEKRNLMIAVAASKESEDACRWTLSNVYRLGTSMNF
uniref:UspA domain-containing protein n=1 Tax=Chlamydomonas euryale TaxID=1486919 RepID=A0A7R9VAA0_9CHLO|mmetsp:Transcript_28273/g.83746  ORF Transcript_28273/g.83746 Transcript_28273/m.83746 type:complete len:127 (+) Transcript_28273:548-928(+)